MPIHPDLLESFAFGYAAAILWANTDGACGADCPQDCEEGHEFSGDPECDPIGQFDAASVAKIREDCAAFVFSNLPDLFAYAERRRHVVRGDWGYVVRGDWGYAGHDFLLTRGGHGAGFWDRGLGELGDRLTAAAKPFGDVYAAEGTDCVTLL